MDIILYLVFIAGILILINILTSRFFSDSNSIQDWKAGWQKKGLNWKTVL